jgi:hypothetical protein
MILSTKHEAQSTRHEHKAANKKRGSATDFAWNRCRTLLEASSGGQGKNSNSSKQQLRPEMALQVPGVSGEIPSNGSAKR